MLITFLIISPFVFLLSSQMIWHFIILYIFLNIFVIVVQVQLSPFSPHHYPHLMLDPTPIWPCPCVLYTCSLMTFFLHYPPSPSPLVTVSLFLISMSLVIFCLLVCFVDQVPLIGEIIWCLSFTAWLTSLSIMLFHSILAVMKCRSSFFLSAVQYPIV